LAAWRLGALISFFPRGAKRLNPCILPAKGRSKEIRYTISALARTTYFLARKGAEAQRKNPFAALREYILFFSHKEKEPAVGMHKKGSPNDTSQFVNIGIW